MIVGVIMSELTEKEIAQKLEKMRESAILDLHEWNSNKGQGIIINSDGSCYEYSWFLGFNAKTNSFGMCTNLEKREKEINCDEVKNYLQNDVLIFDLEYDTNFRSDGGCDIIVKFNDKSKYSNNVKLYNRISKKIESLFK